MTDATKQLLTNLLKGHGIYGHQFGFLLRDMKSNSFVSKVNPRTYRQVKRYLRREKKTGLFVIDKREVRKESGKTWIKQQYNIQRVKIAQA